MSKIAIVFPGQGSQYVGMGKDFLLNFGRAKEVFEEASDATGVDIRKLALEGPEDRLNMTANTQPTILTTSIAALEIIREETGIKADFLAGHSLGEYTALVESGVFLFADAARIVRKRGELMQEAVPAGEGAMAAIIGMEKDDVAALCSEAANGMVVSPANFNSPGQIVIAGQRKGVEKAVELSKERGAKRAIVLPVSVPSHCSLMEEAGKKLKNELETIELGELKIPVISNVEARPYPSSTAVIDILVRQLSYSVRWDDSVLYLKEQGIDAIIEVGPGKVLSGLVKRIEKSFDIYNVEDVESLEKVQSVFG